MRLKITVILSLFTVVFAYTQEQEMAEKIAFVNGQLDGVKMEVKRGELRLEFSRNGKLVKEEEMEIEGMKEAKFSEEEKAIIIACETGNEECIRRKLTVQRKKYFPSRTKLLLREEGKAIEVEQAINDIFQIVMKN